MGTAMRRILGAARRSRPLPTPGLRPGRLRSAGGPFRDGERTAAARPPLLRRERAAPRPVPGRGAGGTRPRRRPGGRRHLLRSRRNPAGCGAGRAGATGAWRWPRAPTSGPECPRDPATTAPRPWRVDSWVAGCPKRRTPRREAARAPWSCGARAARSFCRSATLRGWAAAPRRWPWSAQVGVPGRAAGIAHPRPALARPSRAGSRRLRLAGGPGRCAGRVEAYIDGAWSSVCRDAWSLRDAAVVCRQLRCGTALEAPGPERFGSGTGMPWAGVGGCAGTEAALWDCPARSGGCGGGGG